MGLLSRPKVLSTYSIVIRSVGVREVASGLVIGFSRPSPGSTAGNVVLQIGNSKPLALKVGRFKAACSNDEKLWGRVRPFAGLAQLNSDRSDATS